MLAFYILLHARTIALKNYLCCNSPNAAHTLRRAKPAAHHAGRKWNARQPNKRGETKMANQAKNRAAQAETQTQTLAQVLGSLPNTARNAAPVTPPKAAGSACGKAWVLAAYAARMNGQKPNGETLRALAAENALNAGNVQQEAARYFRWCAQNGHAETSGTLPEAWKISL